MSVDDYNRSFGELIETFEEETENKISSIRQKCVRDFIERLNARNLEWERAFCELLTKSQEDDRIDVLGLNLSLSTNDKSESRADNLQGVVTESIFLNQTKENKKPEPKPVERPATIQETKTPLATVEPPKKEVQLVKLEPQKLKEQECTDPRFCNIDLVREFVRIQQLLEKTAKSCEEISTNPTLKTFKNELNLFVRTQINSISNSDSQHLDNKTRLLTNLFIGQRLNFQDRLIEASRHPQGQLFSMNLAAQTFVTVGTRLVNSVPAIAKSMSSVINGVTKNDLPIFYELVIGHLQERCPYLIPMHPKVIGSSEQANRDVEYKIACGYCFDSKTQSLESEEKFLARMRSMALIYACIVVQGHMHQAWSWLVAFLSLKPQSSITPTILQAFLQEASKKMSSVYGRQYKKLLTFIKDHYVKMIEEVSSKTTDKQPLMRLKNLLSDETNLVAPPSVGSIFGAIKFA